MGRRYLTAEEVGEALNRGKGVECLVGACSKDGRRGFQHLLITQRDDVRLQSFLTNDFESAHSDITEWGPLDSQLNPGDANEEFLFASLDECLSQMQKRWPGSTLRLVNEGMLQDEYADYLRTKQRND